MKEQFFEKEFKNYNDIKIPDSLDFKVRQSLKLAKNKKRKSRLIKFSSVAASFLLAFITMINVSPTIARALYSVPGLNGIVSFVTIDKGYKNAVDKGIYKELYYEEEKNGVKISISSIVGDRNHMWIFYDLNKDITTTYSEFTLIDNATNEPISAGYAYTLNDNNDGAILEVSLSKEETVSNNIKLLCKVYNGMPLDKQEELLAEFEVPINLDSKLLNPEIKAIDIKNRSISTDIGEIIFHKLTSTTTTTTLEFDLSSDRYEFMGFENPRLEDSNGNVYNQSYMYFSETYEPSKSKSVFFQGELKDKIKDLTFKCDGFYYLDTKQNTIEIDLKNKTIEANGLDFELVKLENNILTLKANNMRNVILEASDDQHVGDYNIKKTFPFSEHLTESNVPYEFIDIDISKFNEDKLKLKIIRYIDMTKKTEPFSIKLK